MPKQYKLVRSQFELLETIRQFEDWAWVEERFREIIENPSKSKAAEIYDSLIGQWFSEHQRYHNSEPLPGWAKAIASQHGINLKESKT